MLSEIRPSLSTIIIYLLFTSAFLLGQNPTVGLIQQDSTRIQPGYTLLAPMTYTHTYLIDTNGRIVNEWESDYVAGNSAYLLENGNLLRTADPGSDFFIVGGDAGRVEMFDWGGNLLWAYDYNDSTVRAHHDAEALPNGNVLLIAWERIGEAEAIAAGINPNLMISREIWPDHIIELEPDGNGSATIVWEWHVWDHLIQDYDNTKANYGVVADHPELIDLNYTSNPNNPDWQHMNAIDYNAELDQILINTPFFGEFWIIDHSTTTEEAAGHTGGNSGMGGDLLYRWGNPVVYRAGTVDDKRFFNQHGAEWIEEGLPGAGNIIVFNNGLNQPGDDFSSIVEIVTPIDSAGNYLQPQPGAPFAPADPVWSYIADPPTSFFSRILSGAQRQANGNTLICEGINGRFFEIDASETIVWEYVNPAIASGPVLQGTNLLPGQNLVFRVYRYEADYPGLAGRDLTPGETVERYPLSIADNAPQLPRRIELNQNYPNPFNPSTTIQFNLSHSERVTLTVFNALGQQIAVLANHAAYPAGTHLVQFNASDLASGVYWYRLETERVSDVKKMVLLR